MELNMIKQMERLARKDASIVSLGQGIPSAPAAKYIKDSVIAALQNAEDIDRYSDPLGLPELRHRIAERLHADGMDYADDEIMATAGAIEGINAALLTLISKDRDEVIVPMPTYAAYSRAVRCARGVVMPVALREAEDWRLSLDNVAQKMSSRTAAILLCNPNNPTGSLYDRETLVGLCELAHQNGCKLILDEVYGNMIFDDATLFCPATLQKYRKDIIRVVSFSKDFCLTGWRIGFMHADREVLQQIVPVHDTLINCAPVVSQYAAMAALDIFKETVAANREVYAMRREIMRSYLDELAPSVTYFAPTGGYFFFVKLPEGVDAQTFCWKLAEEAKVVAVPGDDFGLGGAEHVRLCFGRSTEDIHRGMRRLAAYFDHL